MDKISAPAPDAVDKILYELIACVKQFKSPSELDFCPEGDNPMYLLNNERNRSFLNQLCKLDGLRSALVKVSTQGDARLEEKQKLTKMAIERALCKMKEYQLELYRKVSLS
jgi:hypothetical protein